MFPRRLRELVAVVASSFPLKADFLTSFFLFALIFLLPTQTSFHFWPEWSLIGQLKNPYLSFTVYLTDLLALGLLFITRPRLSEFKLFKPLFLAVGLNILFSALPAYSLYAAFKTGLYLILIIMSLKNRQLFDKLFPTAFVLSLFWLLILAMLQVGTAGSVGGFWTWLGERPLSLSSPLVAKFSLGSLGQLIRAYSTFPHPNALADFLGLSFFLLKHLNHRQLISPIIFKLLVIFLLIGLLITFSRSAILSFIIALFLPHLSKNISVKTFALLALGLAFTFLTINFSEPAVIDRLLYAKRSISLIISHPFTGTGYQASTFFSGLDFQPVHNIYLLLLSEWGGLSLFLLLILKTAGKHLVFPIPKALLSGLLFVFITGLFDHYWLTSHQNSLLLAIFSVLIIK